ncbi:MULTISPECIES: serine/threonine protein kinase [Sutcliffiella]|uniref:serine/threonine protein kinase n=1 Tax=Sutcliffiella TaxID=2837511 RepID=UPI0022DCFB1E|nr:MULTISPECIES: protein kinase [Sutcliffiella]MED4018877.1 protein kinase [Sutcliffiella cohnii]WBL17087.1 protein kinase [Sutcliffiella sp. NC1]
MLNRKLKNGTLLHERYILKEFIGQGSYGLTYLALDQKRENIVVVKQNRVRWKKNSRNMFVKEAEILASLQHSSIPKFIDIFTEKKRSYLVMEYIKGKNFEDLVLSDDQKYNEQESLSLLLQVLNIVKYIHSKRIVHQDLRLPNIIKDGNRLYIIDFGLAVHNKESAVTKDFESLGHFLLFLLYSTFEPASKKERCWEQELEIRDDTKRLIRKLFRSEDSYKNVDEIMLEVKKLLITFNDTDKRAN